MAHSAFDVVKHMLCCTQVDSHWLDMSRLRNVARDNSEIYLYRKLVIALSRKITYLEKGKEKEQKEGEDLSTSIYASYPSS